MVQLRNSEKMSVVANIRDHQIVSDVSEPLGGDDFGMNPHEILETALAACTSLTLKMYANRRQIKLVEAKVEVKVSSEGKDSIISRKIELIGDLTTEERDKLVEIADKCPIHKLLVSNIAIQTESL